MSGLGFDVEGPAFVFLLAGIFFDFVGPGPEPTRLRHDALVEPDRGRAVFITARWGRGPGTLENMGDSAVGVGVALKLAGDGEVEFGAELGWEGGHARLSG